SWNRDPALGKSEFIAVDSRRDLVVAATRSEVMISRNHGLDWQLCKLPEPIATIRTVTIAAAQEIVVGSWQGGLRSHDMGKTWDRMLNGLPDRDISSISYDEEGNHLYATSLSSSTIYESSDGGRSWSRGPDSGYPLRYARLIHGRIAGVTRFDGIV